MNFDPLLAGERNYNLPQLEEEQKRLSAKIEQFKEYRLPQSPQSPVWDEIDSIVAGMSEQELQYINSNDEFRDSSDNITSILNREYLRIMRPIVEATKDGKNALETHLTLLKRLRKVARDEVNRKYSIMDEYLETSSDIPFDEFIKAKRAKKNPKNNKI